MKISLSEIRELLGKDLSRKQLEEAFGLHSFEIEEIEEIEGDTVIDLDVLPNRSSDALSVLGLARELSAVLDVPLKDDLLKKPLPTFKETDALKAHIDEDSSATVYGVAQINAVEVKESPKWLRDFLIRQGQKPINNLVDATNYVLFFLGQPTHVFDADKISGDKKIIAVRPAHANEKITTLDDKEYELNESISVIYDAGSDKKEALALAGIKGGKHAELDSNTKNIILESARFDPTATRLASKNLALRTDALKRFENDIPDLLPFYGLDLLIKIIQEIAGGELVSVSFAQVKEPRVNPKIKLELEKINKRLGTDFTMGYVKDILRRLDFEIEDDYARAPWWRTDIAILEDISEEIIRIYGLNNIAPQPLPNTDMKRDLLKSFYWSEKIRGFLAKKGFVELTNSSLQDKGELELANSLASDKNFYRDNLRYQVLKALDKNEPNAALLGIYDAFKVFEIGNVYKDGKEYSSVCIAIRPVAKKKREARAEQLISDLKAEFEKSFAVALPDSQEPGLLEFPLDLLFELPMEEEYPELPILKDLKYKAFSQFPFILRDIAAWVDSKDAEETMREIIKKHAGELLRRIDKFDEFEKDGKVSIALHIIFQADDRTLTDEEIGEIMQKIERDYAESGFEVR